MGTEESELEELRRIAKFFHSIVENIPDMVFVKDAEALRFVLFNRAGEQLTGIPRADLLGKTDYDFFPADEADWFRAKDMETIRRGEVVEIPAEPVLTRDRGERLLHTKKIVIAGDDGKPQYLLGISEDITARRKAEKELEQLRSTVAAAAVHDFRSPLQAILLQLELLAGRIEDDVSQSLVDAIRGDVARLVRLTNDMLDATRVAIEDLPLIREVVDVEDVVERIVDALRPGLAQNPIDVRVRGSIPPISVDPARLEQVIQNLLDNAAKYSSPCVPIRIEVLSESDGACIRVIDHGPGIHPDDLPRVFDRFYQGSSARERRKGLGLGLFIAKGLVTAHGGRIDVASELGRGSEFRVWFPAVTELAR